jgi:hypothetical protein
MLFIEDQLALPDGGHRTSVVVMVKLSTHRWLIE